MVTVLGTLNRLAPTELTITLVGETGTGKDVLSQAIHEHSARSGGPMHWQPGMAMHSTDPRRATRWQADADAAPARSGCSVRRHGALCKLRHRCWA